MGLSSLNGKIVRVTDSEGRVYTGETETLAPKYCLGAFGREEEGIRIGPCVFFASDIIKAEELPHMAVVRATETWQRAGTYYVRIQAMAKKHHITLRQEFDGHDAPETKYILVTDEDFPIATARMYPLDPASAMIGRVVVLPEYRRQGIGAMVVRACEEWAKELGYEKTVVESRDNKTGFYLRMDYEIRGEPTYGETFRCVRMEKKL